MGEPAATCYAESTTDGTEIDIVLSDSAVSEFASTGRFELEISNENVTFDQAGFDHAQGGDSTKIIRVTLRRRIGD